MRVVAVDDHRLVYDALEAVVRLIDPACDLHFAASLEEAFALMASTITADLVLMDLGLPDSQGLVTLERFRSRFPEQPVVVVSGIDERDPRFQETVLQAINEYRAMGFIPKSHDRERGILALRHVLAGNIYFPREAAHSNPSAGGRSGSSASDPIVVHPSDAFDTLRKYGFTEGQLRVARLLLEGHSNKEIARRLLITDHTVKAHAGAIFDTLHVKTRLQAVVRLEKLLREVGDNTH